MSAGFSIYPFRKAAFSELSDLLYCLSLCLSSPKCSYNIMNLSANFTMGSHPHLKLGAMNSSQANNPSLVELWRRWDGNSSSFINPWLPTFLNLLKTNTLTMISANVFIKQSENKIIMLSDEKLIIANLL